MIAPICAALALVLAAPRATAAKPRAARIAARAPTHAAQRQKVAASQLERARASLAAVTRDPSKRRYRHHWERAIAGLERAARGRDRGPALLEAARARYALYRFSQVDGDREEALRLAALADRAGAKEAAPLARAIRREMGEVEAPRAAKAARSTSTPPPARSPATSSAAPRARSTGNPSSTSSTSTSNATSKATSNANAPSSTAPAEPSQSRLSPPPAATSAARGPPSPPLRGGEGEERNPPAPPPPTPPAEDDEEEEPLDPALEKALASDGAAAEAAPSARDDRGPARVSEVKTWSNSEYTRVAVYLSRPVGFTQETLASEASHPRRLALDLAPARLDRGLAHPVGDALVTRVRAAQREGDTVRVVLDLAGKDELTVFSLDDPPRLIVDVGVAEARKAARATALAEDADELAPRRPVHRIVVDAGHGGHDTGAIGPTRVREKDVTLEMAKRLARRLEAKGFEVVLTRRDDTFVALEERTAIANARRGDLFVSLHANAHPRRDRRGVETYVLNVADGRYARRLAARENGALADGEAQDVRRILSDLDAQSSADASRRLAQTVQRELCLGIRGRVGDVRDLGVKSALFHVLLGARMPAVLVETSFISNRSEEKRLASGRFQDEVAGSLARAIERFAAREARVASAR